jgi:CMD domain protein
VSETGSVTSEGDVINAIAGIAPGSRLDRLRRRRGDAFRHVQDSQNALLFPPDDAAIGHTERAAIALRVALIAKDERLATYYRMLLGEAKGEELLAAVVEPEAGGARLGALMRHADLLAQAPGEATVEDLRKLEALGYSSRDIVALAQLVAFVSFQSRLLAGLRILQEERP